jgi:hypothetical protein
MKIGERLVVAYAVGLRCLATLTGKYKKELLGRLPCMEAYPSGSSRATALPAPITAGNVLMRIEAGASAKPYL